MIRKENVGALKQEIKDFKEEVINTLSRIETQTKATNGAVAKALTDIELGKQKMATMTQICDANHANRKEWVLFMASGISSVVTAILVVIILKTFQLG